MQLRCLTVIETKLHLIPAVLLLSCSLNQTAIYAEDRSISPYATAADFAKYAMKLREQTLLEVEPQVFVPTSSRPATQHYPQAIREAPPWKEEIANGYFPYHCLAVRDFPINDGVHLGYGMCTHAFIHWRPEHQWIMQNGLVLDRITEWLVWSGFDRNKSWRKSRLSRFELVNKGLPHEQGHLDIWELHLRPLTEMPLDKLPVGEGVNPQAASADLWRKLEALFDRVVEEGKREQERYDLETAHGANVSKQREWSAAIQARLKRAGIHF